MRRDQLRSLAPADPVNNRCNATDTGKIQPQNRRGRWEPSLPRPDTTYANHNIIMGGLRNVWDPNSGDQLRSVAPVRLGSKTLAFG